MRFNIITMRVGLLFSIAATEIEERASREQSTSAALALASYFSAIVTESAFQSLNTAVTDSAALQSISAWESSVSSIAYAHQTPSSNFLEGLPTQVRSFYSSVYAVETSILAADGIKPTQGSTSISTGGARETGRVVKLGGAVLGVGLGVLMAL